MKNLYKKIHNTHKNKMETIRLGFHVRVELGKDAKSCCKKCIFYWSCVDWDCAIHTYYVHGTYNGK